MRVRFAASYMWYFVRTRIYMRASGVVRKFPLTRDISGLHVVHETWCSAKDYSQLGLFEMTLEFNGTSVLHAFSLVKQPSLIKHKYALGKKI